MLMGALPLIAQKIFYQLLLPEFLPQRLQCIYHRQFFFGLWSLLLSWPNMWLAFALLRPVAGRYFGLLNGQANAFADCIYFQHFYFYLLV